jgi:hypothetical protein
MWNSDVCKLDRRGILTNRNNSGSWAAYSVLMLRWLLNKILTGMILLMGQLNCSRLLTTEPRAILPNPSEASQIGHRTCNLRGRRTKLNNVTINVTHRHIYIRIATHYKLARYVPFQLCSLVSCCCFVFVLYVRTPSLFIFTQLLSFLPTKRFD